ncbi:MAG: DUF418 domain-containing protein [Pseudomonadota bacterium]
MLAEPRIDRFESLDVLRGVAILGIFAVNIFAFGFPWYVIGNPSVFEEFFNSGEFWWTLSTTAFQFKFITIFTMLFGAGIVLFLGTEKPNPKTPLHRRRMFWLFIIGMMHNYLLWYGDILAPYAIAGFLVAGARRWGPITLFIVGFILIIFNFGLFSLQSMGFDYMSPEEIAEMKSQMWAPGAEQLTEELAQYRSGFFERLPFTSQAAFMSQMMQGLFLAMRTIGVMMLGMALFKTGYLTLRRSTGVYLVIGALCAGIGLYGSFWASQQFIGTGFNMKEILPGQSALYWSSLIQSFGYVSIVMGLCKIDALRLLRAPFAAAGRMALSNYLLSTFVGIFIFYGPPGLGKIGTVSFDGLAAITGALWLFILTWSPIWMSVFRYGPAEWVWRSLTYWRLQPILK